MPGWEVVSHHVPEVSTLSEFKGMLSKFVGGTKFRHQVDNREGGVQIQESINTFIAWEKDCQMHLNIRKCIRKLIKSRAFLRKRKPGD